MSGNKLRRLMEGSENRKLKAHSSTVLQKRPQQIHRWFWFQIPITADRCVLGFVCLFLCLFPTFAIKEHGVHSTSMPVKEQSRIRKEHLFSLPSSRRKLINNPGKNFLSPKIWFSKTGRQRPAQLNRSRMWASCASLII